MCNLAVKRDSSWIAQTVDKLLDTSNQDATKCLIKVFETLLGDMLDETHVKPAFRSLLALATQLDRLDKSNPQIKKVSTDLRTKDEEQRENLFY